MLCSQSCRGKDIVYASQAACLVLSILLVELTVSLLVSKELFFQRSSSQPFSDRKILKQRC